MTSKETYIQHSSDTEDDEEVCLNCTRGCDDEDMHSERSCGSPMDDMDEPPTGVVTFVANQLPGGTIPLVCPKAQPGAFAMEPNNHQAKRSTSIRLMPEKDVDHDQPIPTKTSPWAHPSSLNSIHDSDSSSDDNDKVDVELQDILECLETALNYPAEAASPPTVIGMTVGNEPEPRKRTYSTSLVSIQSNDLEQKRRRLYSEDTPFALQDGPRTGSIVVLKPSKRLHDTVPAMTFEMSADMDQQLGEELVGSGGSSHGTPVPLLTPPQSPVTVELDGNTTTMCEWPSNLVVDTAFRVANELRSLSPPTLFLEDF